MRAGTGFSAVGRGGLAEVGQIVTLVAGRLAAEGSPLPSSWLLFAGREVPGLQGLS